MSSAEARGERDLRDTGLAAGELHLRLLKTWGTGSGLIGRLSSVDHKVIGTRYILTAFAFLILGGLAAVVVWHRSGNVAPWAVVQFGGMALVLALALTRPVPSAAGLELGWVIALYALAKAFELADQPIYEATHHLVSGHSLKHLTAALAGLPVLHALRGRRGAGRGTLRHNPGAAELSA